MSEEYREIVPRAKPVVYEIRVKGRLDSRYMAEWIESGTVIVDNAGETILQAPMVDQAELYGLLSRLRDLAVPLISVTLMKDPRIQRKMPLRRIWLLVLFYLLAIGIVSSLIVYLTSMGIVHTALALAILFGILGGVAIMLEQMATNIMWRILTGLNWTAASISLIIYLTETQMLHPALAITILLALLAGGLLYAFARGGVRIVEVESPIEESPTGESPIVEWDELGSREGDWPDSASLG